ncbi:uncharacterized protein LOC130125511 [Lampris incognitus]|uniref:uncharacterized protein LOC130125511 n=1 Tax=Lampris incognitus TaxID=2546036 RepID=UPI0024B5B9ED|nr:uncharacterized protein LOC130125511 [Lampris incognitus]
MVTTVMEIHPVPSSICPASRFPSTQQRQLQPAISLRGAPEVVPGLPVSEAMDTWSLGCVVAAVFLGRHLYPWREEFDTLVFCEQRRAVTLGPAPSTRGPDVVLNSSTRGPPTAVFYSARY